MDLETARLIAAGKAEGLNQRSASVTLQAEENPAPALESLEIPEETKFLLVGSNQKEGGRQKPIILGSAFSATALADSLKDVYPKASSEAQHSLRLMASTFLRLSPAALENVIKEGSAGLGKENRTSEQSVAEFAELEVPSDSDIDDSEVGSDSAD